MLTMLEKKQPKPTPSKSWSARTEEDNLYKSLHLRKKKKHFSSHKQQQQKNHLISLEYGKSSLWDHRYSGLVEVLSFQFHFYFHFRSSLWLSNAILEICPRSFVHSHLIIIFIFIFLFTQPNLNCTSDRS